MVCEACGLHTLLNIPFLFLCLGILGHYPHRRRPRLVVQQGTLAFETHMDI